LSYSVIIPIYNELTHITVLLNEIKSLLLNNHHEIIIVDDGSTDGTTDILKNCQFINFLALSKNYGKGIAVREGLKIASHDKIIIFDGDLEIHPQNILKLMILNKNKGINCVFGSRYVWINPFNSFWDFGNYILTKFFNSIHKTYLIDSLCCAKAFYKKYLQTENLKSEGFDIDIEISKMLLNNIDNINTVFLDYNRRSKKEGKKLNLIDGWAIVKRTLQN
tara:strand:+ start:670 stop:1332 length:663 start_codon:yes stop_codon:yes gene_type:complete